MAEELKYDAFVSYSSKDRVAVSEIAERLRKDGLKVWFDEWEIKPGDNILAKIEDGLEHSRILVLCMSANAFESDWSQLEAGTFRFRDPLNKNRRLIPIRLDDAPIISSMAQFSYINWNSNLPEDQYRRLFDACRAETNWTANRQRICMISSEYPPHVLGGLGVHVARLSEELAALDDIDVVLPYWKPGYSRPPDNVRMYPVAQVEASYDDPISWLHFVQHAFYVVERLVPQPNVIHCHDWVTVLAGVKCRRRLKIPLVFHVHLPNRTPFCASVENLGIACADLVTVNSQAIAAELKDRFPDTKIAVVPNGVDTEIFNPGDPNADLGGYVLFVGRLVEQKGVDHLLHAFVHVLKRFPSVELKIAGSGPCEPAYKRLADCLLIRDHVQFLGWKSDKELSRLYRSASVVAVPSVYEPFGMTALEAMACARPVIASNTGGLREIIRHGETGVLVEPGDHLDLAQWIIHLLDRKDLREKLARQAGLAVNESADYQWPSIARQFASFYYKLSCEPVDLVVPAQAQNYVSQIWQLARGLDKNLPGQIFDWIS